MSTQSIPPAKVRRLATLLAADNFSSITQLSSTLRISHSTIRRYQQRIKALGYSFAEFSKLSPLSTRTALRKEIIQKPRSKRYLTLMSILPDVWDSVSEGENNIYDIWGHIKNATQMVTDIHNSRQAFTCGGRLTVSEQLCQTSGVFRIFQIKILLS